MARYEMEKKDQAATQGTNMQEKKTKKQTSANGKRQTGRNPTRLMARYMVK